MDEDLCHHGGNDIREAFIDSIFAPVKKGPDVGKTKRGNATKIMSVTDASGLPIAAHVESASPHEVKLVEAAIENSFVVHIPEWLIGDKACNSDALDRQLRESRGIEMITPHRREAQKASTPGRPQIQALQTPLESGIPICLATELQANRFPYEYHAENFLGMVQLGCTIILLRYF